MMSCQKNGEEERMESCVAYDGRFLSRKKDNSWHGSLGTGLLDVFLFCWKEEGRIISATVEMRPDLALFYGKT